MLVERLTNAGIMDLQGGGSVQSVQERIRRNTAILILISESHLGTHI